MHIPLHGIDLGQYNATSTVGLSQVHAGRLHGAVQVFEKR
jgi:hypothetical protein